jgi:hypothetical protein
MSAVASPLERSVSENTAPAMPIMMLRMPMETISSTMVNAGRIEGRRSKIEDRAWAHRRDTRDTARFVILDSSFFIRHSSFNSG